MIEHELILLGLLRESPKHGYEIKRTIREILSLFAGIAPKSIYYPLMVLEKKGMVVKRARQEGKRPQRFVYTLTRKGERRFEELLAKSFLDFRRPQFSLDISLYFLKYIKPQIARRRLRARTRILEHLSRELEGMAASLQKKRAFSLARMLEHNLRMVRTEIEFLSSLPAGL